MENLHNGETRVFFSDFLFEIPHSASVHWFIIAVSTFLIDEVMYLHLKSYHAIEALGVFNFQIKN